MRIVLGWMTCTTADPRHLLESHSVAALLKLAVLMSNDVQRTSAVLKIRDVPRISDARKINAVLMMCDVQMRITTHQKRLIIPQLTAFHPLSCHPCSKALRLFTRLFIHLSMKYHHLLKHPRSTQAKSNVRESNLITPLHLLLLASLSELHERWTLMKIMMMRWKKKRREELFLVLGLLLEMPKPALQPALTVMPMVYQTVNLKSRHLLDLIVHLSFATVASKCKSRFLSGVKS
jgi:hypothetical protein